MDQFKTPPKFTKLVTFLSLTIFFLWGQKLAFGKRVKRHSDEGQSEEQHSDDKVGEDKERSIKIMIKEYLTNLTNGDERVPPSYSHHPPTSETSKVLIDRKSPKLQPWVNFQLQPLFVAEMSMTEMDFTVDLIIAITWEDSRIRQPDAELVDHLTDVVDISELVRDSHHSHDTLKVKLWLPTIKWVNCKAKKKTLSGLEENLDEIEVKFFPQMQRIKASFTHSLAFFCDYSFSKYPFDQQRCVIQLSYEQSKPLVNWITKVLIGDTSLIHVPPEFRLVSVTNARCPDMHSDDDKLIECSEYLFIFQRIYAQHVMLLFIPSILIVTLSWISFWLDVEVAAPRVALGLTSLLTLATQFNNAQKNLPAVAEIKAVDVWMFACMITVFASLVEFAITNYTYRSTVKTKQVQKAPNLKYQPNLSTPKYVYSVHKHTKVKHNSFLADYSTTKKSKKNGSKASRCSYWSKGTKLDKQSRIIFPTVFLIFNIVFWAYYLS